MTWSTSLVSLALFWLAGVLLDAHRRDWGTARANPRTERDSLFARRRFRRRTAATTTIAAVAGLIAVWPLLPREPVWVAAYAATLVGAAATIFVLGIVDAWASGRHYRAESRRQLAEHVEELRRLTGGSNPGQPAAETTDEPIRERS